MILLPSMISSSWVFLLISIRWPLPVVVIVGRLPAASAARVLAPTTPSRGSPAAFCSA